MDKPRVRKNHNRRFDSLQYLKLAVHNSWKLTPKVAAAKNIESKNQIKPVILFDEIGLAELSVHNPLKVIIK